MTLNAVILLNKVSQNPYRFTQFTIYRMGKFKNVQHTENSNNHVVWCAPFVTMLHN
jgi:hypothetical protein